MTNPRNRGHGHVLPRPDGFKARCGGPTQCAVCASEAGDYVPDYGPTPDLYKPAPRSYRTILTPRPDLTITLTIEGEPTIEEIRDAQSVLFEALPARKAEQQAYIDHLTKLLDSRRR